MVLVDELDFGRHLDDIAKRGANTAIVAGNDGSVARMLSAAVAVEARESRFPSRRSRPALSGDYDPSQARCEALLTL